MTIVPRGWTVWFAFALLGCGSRTDLGEIVVEMRDAGEDRAPAVVEEAGLDANGRDGGLVAEGRDAGLDANGRDSGDGGRIVDAVAEPIVCEAGLLACDGACVDVQTDTANCGACGHDCLGGACTAGLCQPVTLLSGLDWPSGITVDATYIYWTSAEAGTVSKMPIAGGSPTTLASGQSLASGIAVDGSSVYWATYLNGALMKMPLAGGSPTTLVSTASPKDGPIGVAVDASNVYWSSFWGDTVMEMPLAGGSGPTLLSGVGNPGGLDLDSTYLYCSYLAGNVQPTDGSMIVKLPLAGGPATTVVSVPTVVSDIAVDATRIYWTTEYDGTVMEMPLAGGTLTTLVGGLFYPDGIAVDATSIYWTTTNNPTKSEFSSGTIMRLAKPLQ